MAPTEHGEKWDARAAVVRRIADNGGSILRKHLNGQQLRHIPRILDEGLATEKDGILTLTRTGRAMASRR